MKSYLSPNITLANLSNHAFKMQASGEALAQISCGADRNSTSCTEVPRGSSCFLNDASALIFLPGTTGLSEPICTLIVNGVTGGDCQTDFDDACEGGANWNVTCFDDDYECDVEQNIQIQCTGFETSDCASFG
jgi:hypothetical protein